MNLVSKVRVLIFVRIQMNIKAFKSKIEFYIKLSRMHIFQINKLRV